MVLFWQNRSPWRWYSNVRNIFGKHIEDNAFEQYSRLCIVRWLNYFKGKFLRGWLWLWDIIQNFGPFVLPFSFHASILASIISIGPSSLRFKSLRILFAQQTNNKYNLWALLSLNPFPRRDMLVLVLSYPYVLGLYKIVSPGVFSCDLSWTPNCWTL